MRHRILDRAALLIVSCSLLVAGCGATTRSVGASVASAAAPAATEATLTTLEDPQTRRRLEDGIASPAMQRALRELAGAASEGVLRGLTDDQLEALLAELAHEL